MSEIEVTDEQIAVAVNAYIDAVGCDNELCDPCGIREALFAYERLNRKQCRWGKWKPIKMLMHKHDTVLIKTCTGDMAIGGRSKAGGLYALGPTTGEWIEWTELPGKATEL